jgi:hypothetical protein
VAFKADGLLTKFTYFHYIFVFISHAHILLRAVGGKSDRNAAYTILFGINVVSVIGILRQQPAHEVQTTSA